MKKKGGNHSEEEAWKIRAKTYRSMLHAEIDEKVELNVIATLAQRRIEDLEERERLEPLQSCLATRTGPWVSPSRLILAYNLLFER